MLLGRLRVEGKMVRKLLLKIQTWSVAWIDLVQNRIKLSFLQQMKFRIP